MVNVIKHLRIRGLRCVEDLAIPLGPGLRVLIGENGSGKSTVVEACEILRRSVGSAFWDELNQIHGGVRSLGRLGSNVRFDLVVGAEGLDDVSYALELADEQIVTETVTHIAMGEVRLQRTDGDAFALGPDGQKQALYVNGAKTLVGQGSRDPFFEPMNRVARALENIDVQVPFEVVPKWVAQAHNRKSEMRSAQPLFHAKRLDRLGTNVAAAFDALLKEQSTPDWEFTMDLVRQGLGDWVEKVVPRSDDTGSVSLWLKVAGRDIQIPPAGISAGQLAYLAFVALTRLRPERSILVFDEPELSMHPKMLARVLGLFERVAENTPVLLATHSRRLLDLLDQPAQQVMLLELASDSLATVGLVPDEASLGEWLEDYDGIGDLLDHGMTNAVMKVAGT